ncbi:hypothetical protein G7Y89_g3890 [Cudoniella acicularis]|uniref:Low temperature requirement A n=1 Tax=Cudoniella acicularis TaxID=354080 RepID=A0A8H4RQH8_9HELO|nr:hypothetical protein G7Y89_g3890 [Cudoniella acicularis]
MSDTQNPQPQNNVIFTDTKSNQALKNSSFHRKIWISRGNRSRTNLDEVLIEFRAQKHSEFIRRPRAHQYIELSKTNSNSSSSGQQASRETTHSSSSTSDLEGEKRSSDSIIKQLSRLDLFVDLVWVGIIANLSATFIAQAFTNSGIDIGLAFLEFILLFIPIWRIWDHLRAYCIDFYTDDILQRNFMVWILVLSVCYGINAPYAFVSDGEDSLRILIGVYLVARVSFLLANLLQAIFLPFLRRKFLFRATTTILTGGIWIAAIYVSYPAKIALLVIANAAEHPIDIFLASPTADRLLIPGWKRSVHTSHYVDRHEGFFIIILGEGVFRLIEGSPSGMGLTHKTGTVLTALLMYYVLHWLYFNGDRTKKFIHALRRTWWKPVIWQLAHIFMFASLLILASSTLFLVEHESSTASSNSEPTPSTSTKREESGTPKPHAELYALWSASISLSVTLFFMTIIAILNRPLDKPQTLLINSRWIRLGFRIPVIAVIVCLPLIEDLNGGWWCGAAVFLLYFLFLWEWGTGLERNWRFVEPKEG